MTDMPPGIRNRNPGNIRLNPKNEWEGLAAVQNDPHGFCIFIDPQHGIRAMTKILLTYKEDGLTCIQHYIERWAPPADDNLTDDYIKDVCGRTGIDRGQPLDVENVTLCLPLIKAIIRHENGQQPYNDAVVLEGMGMGGVS